ncbi:uncharacterized protein LOC117299151, partial [Asterias rubens]|uniref:uncharacterized protein LOC117299151 n=1 Tax=Asterias rubens TaxID=7604 RepID=UPI00145593DA
MAALKKTVLLYGDASVQEIDNGVKNKFRWEWLQETVTIDGYQHKLRDCFQKIATAGKVCCNYCNDTINYSANGKRALVSHVKQAKHLKAWHVRRDNMKLVVDSGGVITTETRNAVRTVPLIDRVADSQAMVLGVIAEHSMPMTMAPVVIALAKELAKDSKMLSTLSMDRTSAGYKMYGLEKTFRDKTLAHIKHSPFCLNIDESTSSNNKRVLGVLVSYYSADEGRVMVEHLAALELIRVTTQSVMKALNDLFKEHQI